MQVLREIKQVHSSRSESTVDSWMQESAVA
jgi:hypothetical protein